MIGCQVEEIKRSGKQTNQNSYGYPLVIDWLSIRH
jgi:hypothetical protein